jgi:DNA-binding MarR family transcriptional regulator
MAALVQRTLDLTNAIGYSGQCRAFTHSITAHAGFRLTAAHVRVLEHVRGRNGTTVSNIAASLEIDVAQASRHVADLVERALLERTPDAEDRRRHTIGLTASGLELTTAWVDTWVRRYGRVLADWKADDARLLNSWLSKVFDALSTSLPGRGAVRVDSDEITHAVAPGTPPPARVRELIATLIVLTSWVRQSGGFNRLLERVEAPIRQHDLVVLRDVLANGPASVLEIGMRLGIEASQVGKRLDRLAELGLATRQTAPFDGRVALYEATSAGATLHAAVHAEQWETFSWIAPAIDEDRARRTERLLSRLNSALGISPLAPDELLASPTADRTTQPGSTSLGSG